LNESLRVLVLEDDTNLRELLCETLEDEGYQVESAGDGASALRLTHSETFDLLLVDVRMEGMSGLETFAYMRSRGLDMACLVITGFATEEDSIRAIRLGVGDYLRKPFEMRELLLRLESLGHSHRRARQAKHEQMRLHQQLCWLPRVQGSPLAREAADWAAHLGRCLHLAPVERAELEVAAALAVDSPQTQGQHWVGEALTYWHEHWDGSGPQKLAGEDIPLAARVVRLAVQAAQKGDLVGCDPHLRFALELRTPGPSRAHFDRLLRLAQSLMHSRLYAEAEEILRQAESLASPWDEGEVQLLLAQLEPAPLRLVRLQNLLHSAPPWRLSELQLEAAIVLLDGSEPCPQAVAWARTTQPKTPEMSALRSLLLWSQGQPEATFDLESCLQILLAPAHEARLEQALPWLKEAALKQLSQEPVPSGTPTRRVRGQGLVFSYLEGWARIYAQRLPARRELLAYFQATPQGVPKAWLESLAQHVETSVRSPALALLSRTSVAPASLSIRSMGGFSLSLDGQLIPEKHFRGTRNQMLLAFICQRPQIWAEDQLLDAFWPEDLEKGRKGISNALFHLRKAMGNGDYLRRQHEQIGLVLEFEPWHDLWEIEHLLRLLSQADWPTTCSAMQQLLPLLAGPYLEGCYMDWALERRRQLELGLTQSILSAAERAQTQEAWVLLSGWSQQILNWDPANQRAACLRMQALIAQGRNTDALRTFESVTHHLKEEFELPPSLELLEWSVRARLA
jgi:DNA-binding response OmpR family regulator